MSAVISLRSISARAIVFLPKRIRDMTSVCCVDQMVAALLNRTAAHFHKPGEIDRIEPAESLGDVTRR